MTATTNQAQEISIDQLWKSARLGGLERVKFLRWGNPEGGEHHYVDFGGVGLNLVILLLVRSSPWILELL